MDSPNLVQRDATKREQWWEGKITKEKVVHFYIRVMTSSRAQLNSNNSGVIPMEVDNATGQTNFKKLTPEEQAQLAKEGRCFQCHLQGHMAHDCLKNTN